MTIESFYSLYSLIEAPLLRILEYNPERGYAPNSPIHPTVRLAATLQVFSGGDPLSEF